MYCIVTIACDVTYIAYFHYAQLVVRCASMLDFHPAFEYLPSIVTKARLVLLHRSMYSGGSHTFFFFKSKWSISIVLEAGEALESHNSAPFLNIHLKLFVLKYKSLAQAIFFDLF